MAQADGPAAAGSGLTHVKDLAGKHVVITGASRLEQLRSNLGAVSVIERLTPEVLARIDAITRPLAD